VSQRDRELQEYREEHEHSHGHDHSHSHDHSHEHDHCQKSVSHDHDHGHHNHEGDHHPHHHDHENHHYHSHENQVKQFSDRIESENGTSQRPVNDIAVSDSFMCAAFRCNCDQRGRKQEQEVPRNITSIMLQRYENRTQPYPSKELETIWRCTTSFDRSLDDR